MKTKLILDSQTKILPSGKRYRRVVEVQVEVRGLVKQGSVYLNQDEVGAPVYLTMRWHSTISPGDHRAYTDTVLSAVTKMFGEDTIK